MTLNHVQIAFQGYLDLAPALSLANSDEVSDQVERWLTKEVSPLVEDLGELEWFRSAVLWSGTRLAAGADTPERKAVEEVECRILETARALSKFLEQAEEELTEEQRENCHFERLPKKRVEYIASKPWYDLVREVDAFFGTEQCLYLDPDKNDNEYAFAFRKLDTQFPLGDYVTRLLLARIEFWKGILDRTTKSVTSAIPHGVASKWRSRIHSSGSALSATNDVLREICLQPSSRRLRDACLTLAQVHAAYAPSPRLSWLAPIVINDGFWQVGGKMLRCWIRRGGTTQTIDPRPGGMAGLTPPVKAYLCDPVIIRHVAWALEEILRFSGAADSTPEIINQAKSKAKLVMVDHGHRNVWFDGQTVGDIVWNAHPKSWDLLWQLAMSPEKPIDHEMLASSSQVNFRSRRKRLGELLGETTELNMKIETLRGIGYQLDLKSHDIILLRDDGDGVVKAVSRPQ